MFLRAADWGTFAGWQDPIKPVSATATATALGPPPKVSPTWKLFWASTSATATTSVSTIPSSNQPVEGFVWASTSAPASASVITISSSNQPIIRDPIMVASMKICIIVETASIPVTVRKTFIPPLVS